MDGWMGGWVGGWVDEWLAGWLERWVKGGWRKAGKTNQLANKLRGTLGEQGSQPLPLTIMKTAAWFTC